MSQVHPIDPDGTGQAICPGILPRTLKCGPTGIIILSNFFKSLFKFFFVNYNLNFLYLFTVTTCGHVMHSKCYQTMFDNLVKQHR